MSGLTPGELEEARRLAKEAGQGQVFRGECWLILENDAVTMDEARLELEARGNVIIEYGEAMMIPDPLNPGGLRGPVRAFKVMDTVVVPTMGRG